MLLLLPCMYYLWVWWITGGVQEVVGPSSLTHAQCTWLIWHQNEPRKTWPRPFPQKFHICVQLPRFSRLLQSPESNTHQVNSMISHKHLLTNSAPRIWLSLLLKLDQGDHCPLLARIGHPPNIDQVHFQIYWVPSSLVYLLAKLCRGFPEDVTSAFALVCPLQVATTSNEYGKISEVNIHSLLGKIFKDCEYCLRWQSSRYACVVKQG